MDEILATIRRIIADDERATGAPGGAAATREPGGSAAANAGPFNADGDDAAGDDVLELLDALNEDGSLRRLVSGSAEAQPVLAAPASEGAGPVRRPEGASGPEAPEYARAEAKPPPAEQAGTNDALDERLVSEVTSLAAAAAFARLASAPRRKREPPMVGGRPLDDIVCELLRPLLQAWLDENLPALVERLVQTEIAKISARTGSSSG